MTDRKRSDHFETLKELISLLRKREIRVAAVHIAAYDMCESQYNKGLQLFNLLVRAKRSKSLHKVTREQAKAKISADSQERTFDRLCRTTISKVTESLTFAINTQHPPYSAFARQRYAIHNHYDQASILMLKGATSLARKRLWDAMNSSMKLELFAEQLELITHWKWLMAAESQPKEWRKYELLELEAEHRYKALRVIISSFLFHRMMEDRAGTGKYPLSQLRQAVLQAESYVAETDAVTIKFWAWQLKMEYYAFHSCHLSYRHVAHKLIDLLNGHADLFKRSDKGNLYYQVAVSEIRLCRFGDAKEHLKQAMASYKPDYVNYSKAKQELALAHFYSGEYRDALKLVARRKAGAYVPSFGDPDALYHLAYTLLMIGEPNQALHLARTIPSFDVDQAGYNIGLRILEALIQVELADFTGLESTFRSFYLYIKDGPGLAAVRPRELVIAQYLKSLASNGLDHKVTATVSKDLLTKLASTESGYVWRVRSHELLLIHQYFVAKANGEPYSPTVPRPIADAERVDEEQFRIDVA